MRQKCNVFCVFIFLGTFLLQGCFPENEEGCPEDMYLTFPLKDKYEDGDYDFRIGNDIQLYIFQNNKLTKNILIPYEEIALSTPYVIRKDKDTEGELYFIAWAIEKEASTSTRIPQWEIGDKLDEQKYKLHNQARSTENYLPASAKLYLGTMPSNEIIDEITYHEVPIGNATCRIEVNITDLSNKLFTSNNSFVELHGTMSEMDMFKKGLGTEAIVIKEFDLKDSQTDLVSTGRFGVLPSGPDQSVSVKIYADDVMLQTLNVPQESLPKGAEAGGLIIFNYTLGEAHFFLTIDDYTEKIVIVNEM